MKIAIVHDSLCEFGGAERVLQSFLEIFPYADIYTSTYSKSVLQNYFPSLQKNKLYTLFPENSFIQYHSSLFQMLSPLLWKKFNFQQYDLIISNSSYLNSNCINSRNTPHIQFIQSPPKNIFGIDKKTPLQKILPYHLYVRPYVYNQVHSSKHIIVNSHHMKEKINSVYDVKSKVIYPPVECNFGNLKKQKGKYYILVSRLDRSKSIEIAIETCNTLNLPLKIIGKTNEEMYENYLKRISGPTIQFLGEQTDKSIHNYYANAIAFLFTARNEDFGIAPVEAMAHGVPVIAYYGGGVKETVQEGVNGLFYYEMNADSLVKSIQKLSSYQLNTSLIQQSVQSFSRERFQREVITYIKTMDKS